MEEGFITDDGSKLIQVLFPSRRSVYPVQKIRIMKQPVSLTDWIRSMKLITERYFAVFRSYPLTQQLTRIPFLMR